MYDSGIIFQCQSSKSLKTEDLKVSLNSTMKQIMSVNCHLLLLSGIVKKFLYFTGCGISSNGSKISNA